MLNREGILGADDLPREEVEVAQWGGSVFVRTLSGTERDAFEQAIVSGKGKADLSNIRARLCALSICDEKGERLFTDTDVAALGKKSSRALDKIFAVAQRLSGLSGSDVKDLEKNSGTGQGEDSTSG